MTLEKSNNQGEVSFSSRATPQSRIVSHVPMLLKQPLEHSTPQKRSVSLEFYGGTTHDRTMTHTPETLIPESSIAIGTRSLASSPSSPSLVYQCLHVCDVYENLARVAVHGERVVEEARAVSIHAVHPKPRPAEIIPSRGSERKQAKR